MNKEKIQLVKDNLKAMNKTIAATRALIRDFDKNIGKWEDFGTYTGCRLCVVNDVIDSDYFHNCKMCPLSIEVDSGPCVTSAFCLFEDSLFSSDIMDYSENSKTNAIGV